MRRRGGDPKRPTLSNPFERYDACEHKKVEATTVTETIGVSILGATTRLGHVAVVNCPRTTINGGPIESEPQSEYGYAMTNVRSRVGDLLCRNCRFYNMEPIELLREQALTAQLEADAGQVLQARVEAIRELQARTGITDWGQFQPPQPE